MTRPTHCLWLWIRKGFLGLSLIMLLGLVLVGPVVAQSADEYFSRAVNEYVDGNDRAAQTLLNQALEQNPDHENALQLQSQLDVEPAATDPSGENGSTTVTQQSPETELDDEQTGTMGSPDDSSNAVDTAGTARQGNSTSQPGTVSQSAEAVDDFQPVPEEERQEESPTPPEISESPQDTIRHVNEEYSPPSSRRTESVYGIVARNYEDRVRYVIHTTGTVDYITSQIYDPPMLVIDIPNSVDSLPSSPLEIGFDNNIRVRHSQYRLKPMNVTRVVMDFERWTDHYEVYRDSPGNRVTVDVFKSGESMAEASGAEAMGSTSDSEQMEDGAEQSEDTSRTVEMGTQGAELNVESGNEQTVSVMETADDPLGIKLIGPDGEPASGENVLFEVSSGDGEIDARPDDTGVQRRGVTNDDGRAEALFSAGQTAGTQRVEAYVPNHDVLVEFRVEVTGGTPTQIVKVSGDQQEAMFGRTVDQPPTVRVLDQYGNPVSNVRVEFQDRTGQGFIDADQSEDGIQPATRTDSDGKAQLDIYRLPSDQSENRIRAMAHIPGQDDLSTTFTIFGHAQLLSIDFKDANLQDVLRTLAEIAQWNIVLADEVEGQPLREMSVSVHLREVTALRALDTILDVKGLSRVSDGNVMKIVSKEQAIRKGIPVLQPDELDDYQGNNLVTVTYQLSYLTANSELAGRLQQALMAQNSSVVADENSNSITITDLANNQKRLKQILDNIDKPNAQFQVKVIDLEYKDAQQFQQQLINLLPLGQQATIQYNTRSNALMVYGEQTLINRVEKLVDVLDRPGQLRDNFTFVDMTGYDETRIAEQVNGILGLQVLPLEQVTGLDFDFENPEDALSVIQQSSQLNIQQLLNTANIIPMPRLNSILVFGPKDIQEASVDLINQLKNAKEDYVQSRNYEWYQAKNLSRDRIRDMIGQIGNVQIESEIPISQAMLLASPDQSALDDAMEFLQEIDGAELESNREVLVYSPQFVDPEDLGDDIETYYEDLQEASASGDEDLGDPMPRLLHSGEQRLIFTLQPSDKGFLKDLLNKLDTNLHDEMSVLTYVPEYVDANELESEISEQNIGRLLYVDDNRISLMVPNERKEEMRELLSSIDSPDHTTNVVYLKHTRASEMLTSLQSVQQDMDLNVSFSADQTTNSIIFSAPRSAHDQVRNVISGLDRWQKQVFIEGIILEYTLNEGQQFRYQWFLNPDGQQVDNVDAVPNDEAGAQFGNVGSLGAQGTAGTFTAILNQTDFQSVLSVLANESQSEVLAKPQITAINNQQASIRVGDEQQIQVQRQTEEGVVSSLQAVSAFTELQVTPTITKNRHVLMDILISSDQFTSPQAANVQTQTTRRTTENSVLVQDGQTVVIGGLIEEESQDSEQGVPYLKDVPFAGKLFQSTDQSTNKRELVIFLTPHVIESPAESKRQAQQVSDELQQITPLGVNVNIASQSELARIQGLSPQGNEEQRRQLARQIVLYRESNGPFRNFAELQRVPGMNERIINNIIYRIDYRIDLNTVTVDDLLKIRNIDFETAQAVVEARERTGTFSSISRPRDVFLQHGISEAYYRQYLEPIFAVAGGDMSTSGTSDSSDTNSNYGDDGGASGPGLRGSPTDGSDASNSNDQGPQLPSMQDISGD